MSSHFPIDIVASVVHVLTEMTISIDNKTANGLSLTLKTLNIRFIHILCSNDLFSYRKSHEKELLIKKFVFLFAKSLL